jgi:hypothetical protein
MTVLVDRTKVLPCDLNIDEERCEGCGRDVGHVRRDDIEEIDWVACWVLANEALVCEGCIPHNKFRCRCFDCSANKGET